MKRAGLSRFVAKMANKMNRSLLSFDRCASCACDNTINEGSYYVGRSSLTAPFIDPFLPPLLNSLDICYNE
jgi:hypothetical protein